jgi:hypothetical protein
MVIGGAQLLMIGVLGEYIGKLLSEIKGRPVYFVAEHTVKSAGEAAKDGTKDTRRTAARRGPRLRARRSKRPFCINPYAASGCAPTITAWRPASTTPSGN